MQYACAQAVVVNPPPWITHAYRVNTVGQCCSSIPILPRPSLVKCSESLAGMYLSTHQNHVIFSQNHVIFSKDELMKPTHSFYEYDFNLLLNLGPVFLKLKNWSCLQSVLSIENSGLRPISIVRIRIFIPSTYLVPLGKYFMTPTL